MSLLAGDLSEDSDDYEEDAPAYAATTPASNTASSFAAHAALPPAATPCPMEIDPPSPEPIPNLTTAQEAANAAPAAPRTPTANPAASSLPLTSPPSKRSREQMPPPPPPLEPPSPLCSQSLALDSALDVGLCNESDEWQPAEGKKKKRKGGKRKSSGARQFEAR